MRKLTVKNFSVIKDAELEFGKITVLIGPQASGKSLLCKLAYFLGREVITIAIDRVAKGFDFSDFEAAVRQEFVRWFPRGGWGNDSWSIAFSSHEFVAAISASFVGAGEPVLDFAESFRTAYTARFQARLEEQKKRGILITQALESLAATAFMKLVGRAVWDFGVYIPTERSYFVDTAKGYRVLGAELDPISARFAEFFASSINSSAINRRISAFLKGNVESFQNVWMLAFHDGRVLPFSHLSSGGKEVLPIVAALDYYEHQRGQSGSLHEELYGDRLYVHDDFTIEEPESGVFPLTQYELVKELAALSKEANCQPHFTVTTHSPYILSSFNNLIEAGQVARDHPELRNEVARIIPEQYWIKDDDFEAYSIEDGKLVSILNESGFIEGNYLDKVSEVIGSEFDQLLRLEYDHTHAS
ncbi:ATP-binding protein [Acidicapsa dinghuensis]|uniref:ATP-binding protein n=1 Tax=Acidicapsa dinghuensis TaxID=2218256 RepID=A0ABW1EDS7_9BACT|nr:ATP-binding protein [Acidicapsa dinghuensis]